ncbi:hypothetical protein BVY03_03620 [bacterium K02(2017)]|nr:hypothetical protein BVY03_03620 [bacterium K02(2017)]
MWEGISLILLDLTGVFMITPIGSDKNADNGINYRKSSTGVGKFSDTMALVSSAVGNTVTESLAYSGNTTGAAISAASTNATYSGLLAAGGSSVPTVNSGFTGGAQYLSGGQAAYQTTPGVAGGAGGANVSQDVEGILAETATSQAYLIGIQAQLGQQQSTFTAISNALNVKYSMERSAIQNFRS